MLRTTLNIILICTLSLKISSALDLKEIIVNTDSFFQNITKKYEVTELNKVQGLIDNEINQYLKIATQQLQFTRHKKDLEKSNIQTADSGVFNGLEEVFSLNVSDVRDINVFKRYIGYEQWFIATLTSSNITVHKIFQGDLQMLVLLPIQDASKLHTVKVHKSTLLFAQKSQSITVFYFFQHDRKFSMKEIYQFPVQDLKDLSIWHKKEELLFAASAYNQISIYAWQSDHFDLEQVLPFNSKFSKAFQIDDQNELLIASSSDSTRKVTEIFLYDSRIRQFVIVQTIRRSFDDVALLRLRSAEESESYLILSSGRESTIVYKSSDDVLEGFLPFQEIGPADRVIAINKNNTSLLVLLRGDIVDVYQYDGWRFIRLDSQIFGIESMKVVDFEGEEMLFVKRLDGNWNLNRINWMKVDQPVNFNHEIHKWCSAAKDKAKQIAKPPETEAPIHMSKGQFKRIKVKRVNNMSIKELKNLTERYEQLLSRLVAINESLNQTMAKSLRFKTLRAQTIRADRCKANNLIANLGCDVFSNLPRVDNKHQNLVFEHVKVDRLDGFPYCPVAALELKEVNVKGTLNGADFNEIYKNALRTSGDQIITAEHVFTDLRVHSIIAPNLEPASTYTRQKIRTTAVRAKEFNLTDGGLLLPLDGEPVTMTGTLTASKVRFNGLIDQRGGIKGRSFKRYAPMVNFPEYHELTGDYHLSNVKVTGLLSASDVARSKGGTGKTLGEIVKKAVRLDEDVPVRLALKSDRTLWNNVTLEVLPNWLTRKNRDMVKVTGEKVALKKVTLPDSLYDKLPLPKIETPVCSIGAVTADIKTSAIRVGQAKAKVVESQNVVGAKDLDKAVRDAVVSLSQADLSRKSFTGVVTIKNLYMTDLDNSPFNSFEKLGFKWYRPDVVEGSVKTTNLKVGSLTAYDGIKIPSPTEIRNMIVEANLQVETINGIKLDNVLNKIVKLTGKVHLKNVTFEGILEAEEVETKNVNIDLQNFENSVFLGDKIITGNVEIEGDLWIPNLLSYPPLESVEYVVEGSIKFRKEPNVIALNGKNLHQLLLEIWLLNRPATLKGKVNFGNVTLSHSSPSYRSLQTPYFGSWESLETRLLSKTKLQEIIAPVYIRTASVPNIVISENFTLRSSDPYFNDLLYMSLKKNGNQTIRDNWHFDTLIIEESITLLGKINNLNLSSDVARHDVKNNYVTGEKIVDALTVRNLNGLNFGEWAKDAFMPTNTESPIIIKGRKTFDYLNVRIVHVNGTVMGKKLEDCLLNTGDQIIMAPKVISGSLHAPSLIIDGLVNDIDLDDFANNLLKKDKPFQKIKSKVVFRGNLQIVGDLDAKNMFQHVASLEINSLNETLTSAIKKIKYLKPFAIGLEQTMKRRAIYWDKFELVKDDIIPTAMIPISSTNMTTHFHLIGDCILTSLSEVVCDQQNKYPLKQLSNCTGVLVNQLLSVANIPLVIQVSSGLRSRITIFMYDYVTNSFDITRSVRAPGITQASVSALDGIVWIATRLESQMLLLRFETWDDLQKYNLPDSRIFALDIVPATNEFVLIREDGMWKLEGLTGPRHAFKVDLRAAKFETFTVKNDFFVRLVDAKSASKLLRARYVGV